MPTLLLNLRDVPDDEADEVRALLDAHAIEWYETKPSFWGVSFGGLWARRDDQVAAAREHLADYQRRRAETARARREEDLREGRVAGAWSDLRTRPLQALAALAGIVALLALTLLPFMLLR